MNSIARPAISLAVLGSLATLGLLTAMPALAWGDCDEKADRSATIDASGASRIEIHARAGDLDVRGTGGTGIDVEGVACASSKSLLDDIQIATERSGDTVRITAEIPETSGWNKQARLDLRITVPRDIAIELRDSSGDISIRDVTLTSVEDSSGDFIATGVRGNFEINDSSGDVRIDEVDGDLQLHDSSGDLRIRGVRGTIVVAQDSSGDMDFEDVTGSVRIQRDSSGDIVVANVGGDFIVDRDGSGTIRHRGVEGRVDIPADD